LSRHLGATAVVAWGVYIVIAAVSAAVICRLWRRPVSYNFKAAAVAVGTFLVTPYAMSYDLVVLAVSVAFLLREDLATGFHRGDLLVYGIALFAPLYPMVADDIMPLLPLTNALLLGWILFRAKRVAAQPAQVSASL